MIFTVHDCKNHTKEIHRESRTKWRKGDFDAKREPGHDRCYLVCSEEEVKRDCTKVNSALVMAYRRGWSVVKPSFIEWAAKEKIPPKIEEHAVDLSPLASLSSGVCGATQESVEQLRFR